MTGQEQRFSFNRIERPMVVTERSGLTREQAINAIEAARERTTPTGQDEREVCHFAHYGATNALCDETVPRSTEWDASEGEWKSVRFTTRRGRVTCRECQFRFGSTSDRDEREAIDRGDEQVKIIADAWMLHQGYTQEEIEASVNGLDHSLCEMIPGVGWDCMDEDGSNRHPEYVALCEASEMANVALDALAQAGFHLTPTAEVKAEALDEFVAKVTGELAATRDEGIDLGEHYLHGMRSALRQATEYATHLHENGGES